MAELTRPCCVEGDTGLEGTLFGLLDLETDRKLMSDVQDTLVSMLQAMAADNLTRWLMLIKDVLQASTGTPPHVALSVDNLVQIPREGVS